MDRITEKDLAGLKTIADPDAGIPHHITRRRLINAGLATIPTRGKDKGNLKLTAKGARVLKRGE